MSELNVDMPFVPGAAARRRSRLGRTLTRAGLDSAVLFTVFGRGWQVIAGAITVVIVSRSLTPSEQGYYFTFNSLIGLQVFFELGLSYVIMQVASHERSRLEISRDARFEGSPEARKRLGSLFRSALRWYLTAALAVLAVILPAGLWFFARDATAGTVTWATPWAGVVLFTALLLLVSPVLSLLEGCGFVADVARLRLAQGLIAMPLLWIVLVAGGGLFGATAYSAGMALVAFGWLGWRYRQLLFSLHASFDPDTRLDWRQEVWPFQWKIAVSWLSGWLIFSLFNPILFAFHGPAVAGQMGMSLSITNAVGTVAFAWVNTKGPAFGVHVARGEFAALDALWKRAVAQSSGVLLAGALTVFAGAYYLHATGSAWASRILAPLPFGMLLLTVVINHIVFSEAVYLRAHKREPFVGLSIALALTNVGAALLFGRLYGATGLTIAFFVLTAVIGLGGGTLVFITKRRQWRLEPLT